MALGGCLFRVVKSTVATIQGDLETVSEELDMAIEALRRPQLCETTEAISDLFDE